MIPHNHNRKPRRPRMVAVQRKQPRGLQWILLKHADRFDLTTRRMSFEGWLDAFWRGRCPQKQNRGRRKKQELVA